VPPSIISGQVVANELIKRDKNAKPIRAKAVS